MTVMNVSYKQERNLTNCANGAKMIDLLCYLNECYYNTVAVTACPTAQKNDVFH